MYAVCVPRGAQHQKRLCPGRAQPMKKVACVKRVGYQGSERQKRARSPACLIEVLPCSVRAVWLAFVETMRVCRGGSICLMGGILVVRQHYLTRTPCLVAKTTYEAGRLLAPLLAWVYDSRNAGRCSRQRC